MHSSMIIISTEAYRVQGEIYRIYIQSVFRNRNFWDAKMTKHLNPEVKISTCRFFRNGMFKFRDNEMPSEILTIHQPRLTVQHCILYEFIMSVRVG